MAGGRRAGLNHFSLYFAFIEAYLSIVLGRILRQNGRVLDRMDEGFRRMDERMGEGSGRADEGHKLIARLFVEENEETRRDISFSAWLRKTSAFSLVITLFLFQFFPLSRNRLFQKGSDQNL